MKNTITKSIALSLITACIASASFASDVAVITTQKGCLGAYAEFETALNAAHRNNELLTVRIDNKANAEMVSDECMINLVYDVDTEQDMKDLHAKLNTYISGVTGYKMPSEPTKYVVN